MGTNVAKLSLENFIEKENTFIHSFRNLSEIENNLGCIDGLIIGTGRPDYTQSSTEYTLAVNDKEFLLIDIPGIEGDERKFKEIIKDSLMKAHVIFYVNGSGKKAEKDTLEKIKNYMHDRTSVYAVFNVHCKGQKERIPGLDKTYQEDLEKEYSKIKNEIAQQTEKELKAFLGENYKGSICVNGLLSFCSLAFDEQGHSTIVDDVDKNLRGDQRTLLKEYANDWVSMRQDSCIHQVQGVIADKIGHFDEFIVEENLKKLKVRLSDMISDVTSLREKEKKKIKEFLREYDDFERNCENAKDLLIQTIGCIGRTQVEDAFLVAKEELFQLAEDLKGKVNQDTVESVLEKHQNQIMADITDKVGTKMKKANEDYQASMQDAQNRLLKDMEQSRSKFSLALNKDMFFTKTFNGERYTFKKFAKDAADIGGYTVAGLKIGTIIPGVGNVVGSIIGFFVGLGVKLYEWLSSTQSKINRAKQRIQEAIDSVVDQVTENIKNQIEEMGIVDQINQNHRELQNNIASQKAGLQSVERALNMVVLELTNRYKSL